MTDKCPKCGGVDLRIRYHEAREFPRQSCERHYGQSRYYSDRDDEHLHLFCKTCSYDWTKDVAKR